MKTISDIAKVIDSLHSTPKYAKSGYPMARVQDINNDFLDLRSALFVDEESYKAHTKNHKPSYGDIVITRVGSYGMLSLVETKEDFCLGQNIAIISPNADSKFLYYYLKSPYIQNYITGNTGGSAYKSLSLERIRSLPYIVPEGDSIKAGNFLYTIDKKIELNRKINAKLEQMARTLYDYWFVQFDFPDANGKPYKSSGGQMIYNDQIKREIPVGWRAQDMYNNDLFDIIKPKIDKFVGEKQYIATADVDSLNISKGSPIIYENRESRANMQPKKYTVWFAKMKASIKHILVGDYSDDLLQNSIFSTGFMGMQTSKEVFEYLAFTVHRPYFELVKDANSNGATMAAIGNNDMKNIRLLVPSPDVITGFHEAVRPILQKIDQNRQQSQKLAELRDWLLPMLMTGQVKVV